MIVKVENLNITQVCFKAVPKDNFYGKCNWARVTFDCDNWSMMATSDSGDFAYTWSVEHGDRTFLMLMSEVNREYLLEKISDLSQFDLEGTKQLFIDCNELNEEQMQFVSGLRGIPSAEIFINELAESELFEYWADAYEYISYDYPVRAKNFVDVFIDAIQPALKRLFVVQNRQKKTCENKVVIDYDGFKDVLGEYLSKSLVDEVISCMNDNLVFIEDILESRCSDEY